MGIADTKIPDKQPYKLSGKEYITTRGLNLYDFGARMHDPAAMRFSTPDPLMEQYPSLSPYTYCAANPKKYFDLYGLKTYKIDESGCLISTEENDKEDVIIIFEGDEEVARYRMGGIYIENNYRNSYDYIKREDNTRRRGFFDYYRIRGDGNAKDLFFFLAYNTNAEWSLALTGEVSNGLCFLSTSYQIDTEPGMSFLLWNQLYHGYYIRELYHNHTYLYGSENPSSSDISFATSVNKVYNGPEHSRYYNDISFFLAVPKLGYKYLLQFYGE